MTLIWQGLWIVATTFGMVFIPIIVASALLANVLSRQEFDALAVAGAGFGVGGCLLVFGVGMVGLHEVGRMYERDQHRQSALEASRER